MIKSAIEKKVQQSLKRNSERIRFGARKASFPSIKIASIVLILVSSLLPIFFPPVTTSAFAGISHSTGGMAVQSEVYVANFNEFQNNGSLSVINGSNDKVVDTITVGAEPYGGAYDPQNKQIYVVDYATGLFGHGGIVTIVNSKDNKVTKSIKSGGGQPGSAAFDPHNGDVYVANYCTSCTSGSTVSVIDPATNHIIAKINVGEGPVAVVFNSKNDELYVPNVFSDTISVINDSSNTVITTMSDCFTQGCIDAPLAAALNSANNELYVTNYNTNVVAIFSCKTNTFLKTVQVGNSPDGAAYDPSNRSIYVTNAFGNSVNVINSKNKVVAEINVGSQPYGLAFDPSNGEMYVANFASNTVSAINCTTNKVIKTVEVGTDPIGVVVS